MVQAKQGRLREEEAKKYFQQLINAVDYCHNKGVYHRDLKVSFIIFEFNLTTKITLEKKIHSSRLNSIHAVRESSTR